MADPMKPALTKWQWDDAKRYLVVQAERYGEPDMPSANCGAAEIHAYPDRIEVTSHEYSTIAVIDTPEQRHAIAALALYGQPYGFTRDMVTALRGVEPLVYIPCEMGLIHEAADRIEALLPPEAPNGEG